MMTVMVVSDTLDAFPLDPTEIFDSDGDNIGDNADTNTDSDRDGYDDGIDAFPTNPSEHLDTDADVVLAIDKTLTTTTTALLISLMPSHWTQLNVSTQMAMALETLLMVMTMETVSKI